MECHSRTGPSPGPPRALSRRYQTPSAMVPMPATQPKRSAAIQVPRQSGAPYKLPAFTCIHPPAERTMLGVHAASTGQRTERSSKAEACITEVTLQPPSLPTKQVELYVLPA